MSISHTVLGPPDGDNALHVVVDTGQSRHALLFDCGEGCAANLKISELQAIEHLCFSHFHMDHVAGFDTFFRHNYNRPDIPVNVWGPEQTISVMHHRFQGFSWNLHHDQPGEWNIYEISANEVRAATFITREAFETAHPLPSPSVDPIISHSAFSVETRVLNHGTTPSIGYKIIEHDRTNIDTEKLTALGLRSGPWLKAVADTAAMPDSKIVIVDDREHRIGDLRERLLVTSTGESLAYLTDFCLGENDRPEIVKWLRGTDVLVCEAQYRHGDLELAQKNHHATTRLVGELARDAEVGRLVLQHVSRRYNANEWREMLAEAQAVFPNAEFPAHWKV